MSSLLTFPRFISIGASMSSSSTKYLRYMNEESTTHQFFQFIEDDVLGSPYTKFSLEHPKTVVAEDFVHIRNCYNNKYLRKSSPDEDWIIGAADEPEEDQSKWSCTLFQAVAIDSEAVRFNLFHVQTGRFVGPSSSQIHPNCLQILRGGAKPLQFVDMDAMVILPKYAAFKGPNGKFLSDTWTDPNYGYNKFRFDHHEVKEAQYEVVPFRDGIVRIKSLYYNVFWRRSPNWIWSDGGDDTSNKDTLFLPVKLGGNKIALKNLGNNQFCMSLTTEGKTDCLNAHTPEIRPESWLEVVEAIRRREILEVEYRTRDASKYNVYPVEAFTQEVANEGTKEAETEVSFSYTETTSNTWNKSNSWSIGGSVSMEVGIPFVNKKTAKITVESKYSGQYSWGQSKEKSFESTARQKVNVPAGTKRRVTMLVQKGSIDIPFTYTQIDSLYDGTTRKTREADGIYSGVYTDVNFLVSTPQKI